MFGNLRRVSLALTLAAVPLASAAHGGDEIAPQQFADLGECATQSGEAIRDCRIGFRTIGRLNEKRDNAVLVPTWYGGVSQEHLYLAAHEVIDPDRFFIIIVDALGNGVSTSPSNSGPQPNGSFPALTVTDMVDSQYRLLTERFGLERLHAIVGLSMGAMQAFEWSVAHPGFAKRTAAAIGSPRLASYDIVLWDTRNTLLELARTCNCNAPREALAGVAMLSSVPEKLAEELSPDAAMGEIADRAARNPIGPGKSWDQQRQAEAMIAHNIARGFGNDMSQAVAATKSEFLIVVSADDRVVTNGPALEFARLAGAQTLILDADCGHGDPWCDPTAFNTAIRRFLERE